MKMFIYLIMAFTVAFLSMVEKAIAGYSLTYFAFAFGAFFLWLCAYGSFVEQRDKDKSSSDE
jgi:ABC-type glycerol-3-phosphate transport system permease component